MYHNVKSVLVSSLAGAARFSSRTRIPHQLAYNLFSSSSSGKKTMNSAFSEAVKVLDMNGSAEGLNGSSKSKSTSGGGGSAGRSLVRKSAKLELGLEKAEKSVLDDASQGISDAACEDIMDDMNELLASKTFLHFFRRGITASQVVEVVHVDINQDYSHATAYWKSSFVNRFISFVAKEKGAELGDNVRGIEVAEKLHKQFTKLINTRLQDSESRFRSNLLKTMSFRRVPRIFFRPLAKRRGVGSGKQKSTSNGKKVYDGSANEDYMEFLRSTTVF